MDRRIFGIETEFGIAYRDSAGRILPPEELARFLFRPVIRWGKSSNVFLNNGARLYLDVGSHPEYASPECDDLLQLITYDRAGERIVQGLAEGAREEMAKEGYEGQVYLFKNNTDFSGNSYGTHENYLIPRKLELSRLLDHLVPFLVVRQMLVGAGKIVGEPGARSYSFSQRADHLFEGMSSSTTRSRPLINTRDEPHADPQYYRRLHVVSGDSNMSETTALLKVGTVDLLLRMIESGALMPSFRLANPGQALREVSHDFNGRTLLKMADGTTVRASELLGEFFAQMSNFVSSHGKHHAQLDYLFDLWERTAHAIDTQDFSGIDREIDWAIKKKLMDEYQRGRQLDFNSARLDQLDLTYHDLNPQRGLFKILERRGLAARITEESQITTALERPPGTTRANVRGAFVQAARRAGRDFTVDWVHLKLNDRAHEALMCKDPFVAQDPRVDELIRSMQT